MRHGLSVLFVVLLSVSLRAAEKEPPAPLSPAETVKRMQLPPGFKATVFAAEPDVVQPMAMTFDDRGRLWVVECLSYPDWITPDGKIVRNGKTIEPKDKSQVKGRDRITIFEDTDGDGKHDKKTVFYDKGVNFTGIEYGFGGVFVTAVPYLLFIPDKNRDDKPDGPPQILLDGWDLKAKHNVVNGLTWGPDGWLYGCNGILSNSEVRVMANQKRKAESGKPGVKMNCGVWRYHPTRKVFEVVAHGTTNPWGLDFNEDGEMFITNCVIKHVFHVIPGAHYERMFGQDLTPNVYGLMESCADHIHWGGGKWTTSRGGHGKHDKPGGGHAHVGCMIYLGDNWPAKYRGKVFTCNLHGRRVNMDVLRRKGSGYVASHGPDFLKVPDPWFRGLELKYGPDGGVYLTDWSDIGECHDRDSIHRENGRIYKITFGDVKKWKGDLEKLKDAPLLDLLTHKNRWFARRARRLIHERATSGKLDDEIAYFEAEAASRNPLKHSNPVLDFLWTMHLAHKQSKGPWEDVNELNRAWSIRLTLDNGKVLPKDQKQLVAMAINDKSPRVRLALASGLQRFPIKDRWAIAEALVAHGEDAKDANIPLMIWYGIEPAVSKDRKRAIALLKKTKIPLIRQYIARRLAEMAK
ncbi:MAG: PVC-type heme-binding CxxCH protein [Planctomycetaceae bacterium]